MSILPAAFQIQTFPCPYCRQEISAEAKACKFCSTPLAENLKKYAVERKIVSEIEEKIHAHKKSILTGVGLMALGGFCFVPPISSTACGPVIFIIFGLVQVAKGFTGYREEKKKLENV